MSHVQGWYCSGVLAADAQLKYMPSGTAVLDFEMVSRRSYEVNGAMKEEECTAPCTVFGKRAQDLAPQLKAGTEILVTGRWKIERWNNKEGQPRSKHKVSVLDVEILSRAQPAAQAKADNLDDSDTPF